jgi:hypothetical protein
MKGIGITYGEPGQAELYGGGKRPFIKRTCRSKSRCGGAYWTMAETVRPLGGKFATVLVGGKRPFRKRTCRSKSRCGGAGAANGANWLWAETARQTPF